MPARLASRIWQLEDDTLDATLAVHCPLDYTPLVPHRRLMRSLAGSATDSHRPNRL